jgi:pantothenate kinase type III
LSTAQLPAATPTSMSKTMPANAVSADHLFADNTQDAIINGCISAQVGAITRALAAHAPARCIISGGAASYISPHLPSPCEQVDNLVLIGLAASLHGIEQEYKPK